MAAPLIFLENVLVRRGPSFRVAVRHFTVAPGESVAIVGRSGSGNSTCLDAMAGILRPDDGGRFEMRLRAEAAPISVPALWAAPRQDALRELRGRHLGYVLQTGGLVPFLSIGVRSRAGDLQGGIRLPVAHIAPGQLAVVAQDTYRDLIDPGDVEVYSLPDPEPEERARYWEFRPLD